MNPTPKSKASAPTRVRSLGETSVRSFGRAVARDPDTVVVVMGYLVGAVETRRIIATGSVEGQFDGCMALTLAGSFALDERFTEPSLRSGGSPAMTFASWAPVPAAGAFRLRRRIGACG